MLPAISFLGCNSIGLLENLRRKLPHGDDSLTAKSPTKGTRRGEKEARRKLIGIGLSSMTTDRDRDLSLVPNSDPLSQVAIMHHHYMHILEFIQFLIPFLERRGWNSVRFERDMWFDSWHKHSAATKYVWSHT